MNLHSLRRDQVEISRQVLSEMTSKEQNSLGINWLLFDFKLA